MLKAASRIDFISRGHSFQTAVDDDVALSFITVILEFSMLSLAWTILSMLNMGGLLPHMMQFLRIFSFVFFQVSPQSAYKSAYIVTVVAFFCLFSTVCFQMCP